MAFKPVSPSTVRSYFDSIGQPIPATGRISDEHREAYNKANKGRPYVPGAYRPTVEVTAKPAEGGRKVTRKVNVNDVRAEALAAGVPVGARGRLPREVMEAAVLGTLSSLASAATVDA